MNRRLLIILLVIIIFIKPSILFSLTIDEERKYGAQLYSEIAKSAIINNDPYISLHLRTIKERLETVVKMPFPIVITLIDSPVLDAFATIGGFIYITTGLIAQCDKEDELAGVIAHEFAHIYRRHIAKRYEKEKFINIGMLGSIFLAMLAPDSKTQEAIMATGIASAQTMALKYSREDEDEADRFGSKFADSAGYSGLGIADFLKKLRLTAGDNTLPQYLLTHPYHEERIIKLENIWKEKKAVSDSPLFPFLVLRANLMVTKQGVQRDDLWINNYKKDKDNPLYAYSAYLVFSKKGKINEALEAARNIKSPVKDLLYGEALTTSGRFKEAIEILKNITQDNECYNVSRIFLARAYEALGEFENALNAWKEILGYGNSYPEIFYRFAMLSGRMGMEARGFEYLGRYYLALGRMDLAKTNLERAISRYGINSKEAKELLTILEGIK